MADAVEAGLTRTVGFPITTRPNPPGACRLARRGHPPGNNQVKYSLLHAVLNAMACKNLPGISVTLMPIAPSKWHAHGKYTPQNPPSGTRRRRFNNEYLTKIAPLITLLSQMGQAHGGKTPARWRSIG